MQESKSGCIEGKRERTVLPAEGERESCNSVQTDKTPSFLPRHVSASMFVELVIRPMNWGHALCGVSRTALRFCLLKVLGSLHLSTWHGCSFPPFSLSFCFFGGVRAIQSLNPFERPLP